MMGEPTSEASGPLESAFDPFKGWGDAERERKVQEFLDKSQLHTFDIEFKRGARLAQSEDTFKKAPVWRVIPGGKPSAGPVPELLDFESDQLEKEFETHPRHFAMSQENQLQEIEPGWNSMTQNRHATATAAFLFHWRRYLFELKCGLKQYAYQRSSVQALVACCSIGAAIQGWDETAVNGGAYFD